MEEITKKLEKILNLRKNDSSEKSYVASLYNKGDEAILKKIIEEAGEVIMAVKDNQDDKIIYEVEQEVNGVIKKYPLFLVIAKKTRKLL